MFRRFIVIVLVLLLAGLAVLLWTERNSPSPVWQPWLDSIKQVLRTDSPGPETVPEPESTPSATPTPSPTPVSTPTPTPAPPPLPSPIATPESTPDPLDWALRHREAVPKKILLREEREFPVLIEGEAAGSVRLPAGSPLVVLDFDREEVGVEWGEQTLRIPQGATDFQERVAAVMRDAGRGTAADVRGPPTDREAPPSPTPVPGVSESAIAESDEKEDGAGDEKLPSDWIEVQSGGLPIIITAPHGGEIVPDNIPDRSYGTLVTDRRTDVLAQQISDAFQHYFQARPYLVICHVQRTKIDCNREVVEAAQGNALAEAIWHAFHDAIARQREEILQKWGAGLLLDIHGHSHKIPWIELGYSVKKAALDQSDEELNRDETQLTRSSIRGLVARSPASFSELLRGTHSLGTLLEEKGFPSVPSTENPSPGDERYFIGGYISVTHGSRTGGEFSAIQLELNYKGLRESAATRKKFARALAESVDVYFQTHFGMDLKEKAAK